MTNKPAIVEESAFSEADGEDAEWADIRAPYWVVSDGAYIIGEVVEKHFNVQSKYGKRDLIDVILLKDTVVSAGKGKTASLSKGALCRIAYRPAMGPLLDMLEPGDGLSIRVTGKVPTDKGNDAWTFKTKRRAAKKMQEDEEDTPPF